MSIFLDTVADIGEIWTRITHILCVYLCMHM